MSSEVAFVISTVAGGAVAAYSGVVKKLVRTVGAVVVILLYVLCTVSRLVLIVLLYVGGLIVLAAVLRVFLVVHMRYLPFLSLQG